MYEEEKKDCSNSEMSEDQEKNVEEPTAASSNDSPNADTEPVDGREPDSESEGSCSESESGDDEVPSEAMPDGDTNDDLHALLAYSKNRLEQAQKTPPEMLEDEVEDDHVEDEDQPDVGDASGADTSATDEQDAGAAPAESGAGEDQLIVPPRDESSNGKRSESSVMEGKSDEELLKLAEEKVRLAEEKARLDGEDETEEKAAEAPSARRNENSELWALLNYSKMRLETGATPSLGKKPAGKDDQSVSSKLSKTSKRSLGSKSATNSVTVEGSPAVSPLNGDGGDKPDVPFPDVTDGGNVSVDGSVSLDSKQDEDEEHSDESDEESSEDEDEEGEDELPSFLQNEHEAIDAEEAKAMYEAAKFKAASILSVSEESLTDVQMLQAIAIAEEAARNGDEKFTTKRSLFKLNEAKIDDLKSFLNLGQDGAHDNNTNQAGNQQVGWGIGRGRFIKKVGSIVQNFKMKCEELDEKKQQERAGKPTDVELLRAAGYDLKAQIEAEFLQIAEQQAQHMEKLNMSSRLSSRAQDGKAGDI